MVFTVTLIFFMAIHAQGQIKRDITDLKVPRDELHGRGTKDFKNKIKEW